jgi:hypothetical protein
MPYYPFSEGSLTIAEQMMSNYYHIADGSQYPYSVSANNGFTLASATYNLGASTSAFQDAHCVSLHISDSVASSDKSIWYLIAEETLTDTATSITFSLTSGFDGDSCEEYRIFSKFVANTDTMYCIINGDSAANYGFQRLTGQSSAAGAFRDTSENKIIVGDVNVNTGTAKISYSELLLYSKVGNERLGFSNFGALMTGDYVRFIALRGVIWNNTADTITTFKFYTSSGAPLLTGTNIQIWGRQ